MSLLDSATLSAPIPPEELTMPRYLALFSYSDEAMARASFSEPGR
jgi:hypothetical protein